MTMPIVWVRWVDCISVDEWQSHPITELPVILSVGYLVEETEAVIVVAHSIAEDPSEIEYCGYTMTIPRGCVLSLKHIDEPTEI